MERQAGRGEPDAARLLLAIDSSTEQAGVALFDGARVAELSWHAGREQTVTLLAQVHAVMALLGLVVADLGAVAVATGPGTFNGLRVGMSVAKGLVLGLGPGVALLGVPTLDAAAMPHAAGGRPVVAVVAAGRGRLVWAAYGPGDGGWHQTATPRNGTVEELAEQVAGMLEETIVTGELSPSQEAIVAAVPGVAVPPRLLRARRPAAVAELAWRRWRAGEADDPVTLEPVYLSR